MSRATEVRSHHRPALDGLRGLAIALVVLFHLDVAVGRGGYLGVDLFFVLSGYLISSLVLDDAERANPVGLGTFYRHRVRRLLPALLVTVIGVLVAVVVLGRVAPTTVPINLTNFTTAIVATVGSVGNWWGHASITPLGHSWSLGIEEQFYLVIPAVLVIGARRRGLLPVVAGLLIVGGFVFLALVGPHHPATAYYSTLGRVGELGAGLALALVARRGTLPDWCRRTPWWGWGALLVILGLAQVPEVGGLVRWPPAWIFEYGMVLTTGGAVLVLATVLWQPAHPLTRGLAWPPLVWLGTISYSLYLVHWPVIFLLTAAHTGWPTVVVTLARVVLSIALAAALSRWVERPLRRRPLSHRGLATLLAIGVGVAVVTPLLLAPSVAAPFAGPTPTATTPVPLIDQAPAFGPPLRWTTPPSAVSTEVLGGGEVAPLLPALRAALGPDLLVNVQVGWGLTQHQGQRLSAAEQTQAINLTMVGLHQRRVRLVLLAFGPGDKTMIVHHPRLVRRTYSRLITAMLGQAQGTDLVLLDPLVADTTPSSYATTVAAWNEEFARAHPGRVRALPSPVVRQGHLQSFLPPTDQLDAPTTHWVRVLGTDQATLCPPGVTRVVAGVLTATGWPAPLQAAWFRGSWTHAAVFTPTGLCLNDHPR